VVAPVRCVQKIFYILEKARPNDRTIAAPPCCGRPIHGASSATNHQRRRSGYRSPDQLDTDVPGGVENGDRLRDKNRSEGVAAVRGGRLHADEVSAGNGRGIREERERRQGSPGHDEVVKG